MREEEPGVSVHINSEVPLAYVEKLIRDISEDGEPVEFFIRRN